MVVVVLCDSSVAAVLLSSHPNFLVQSSWMRDDILGFNMCVRSPILL